MKLIVFNKKQFSICIPTVHLVCWSYSCKRTSSLLPFFQKKETKSLGLLLIWADAIPLTWIEPYNFISAGNFDMVIYRFFSCLFSYWLPWTLVLPFSLLCFALPYIFIVLDSLPWVWC